MRRSPTIAPVLVGLLACTLLLAVAGVPGAGASGASTAEAGGAASATIAADPSLEPCAADSPANFSAPDGGDAIGYVDGYWYDEPISIANDSGNRTGGNETKDGTNDTAFNASDGLSDAELSALVTRTAARVEALRCHSFDAVPPVRVVNRSTVRANQLEAVTNRSLADRRFDAGRLSTALVLGDATNVSEARAETTAAATLGYYDVEGDEIVVVAEEGEVAELDEPTLAHELVHVLQDQQFGLGQFDAATTDGRMAATGLIEGDATLVERRYRFRCDDGDWARGCLEADGGAPGNSEYVALELLRFQPYNDGPAYVERLYDVGGWDAVDARFDDPPASTKQLLAPETPVNFEPANVTFSPVNHSAWTRVEPPDGAPYDVLGPGTIGAAMIAPTFEPEIDDIYGPGLVTNDATPGARRPLTPYQYAVDATEGWAGGRLEVYLNDANLTATRWRTEWETEVAARTFRQRYAQLLDVRGAQSSDEFVGTYSFPTTSSYGGQYAVRRNGTAVVVVTGPDLEAVRALDDQVARQPRKDSSSPGRIGASRRAAESALSGAGAVGAVLAIVAIVTAVVIAVRRRGYGGK
jgi:hypothetical protein